jgi:hypothetical protein
MRETLFLRYFYQLKLFFKRGHFKRFEIIRIKTENFKEIFSRVLVTFKNLSPFSKLYLFLVKPSKNLAFSSVSLRTETDTVTLR